MEDHGLHQGYPYEFDILLDQQYLATSEKNFRGHLIFHDTIANIFIFQEEEKEGKKSSSKAESLAQEATSSAQEAAKSSFPSIRLIKGDCIANCKPCPLIHLKERLNDLRKEWESFMSRKAKNEEEQLVVDNTVNGQEAFNILSERYGEDAKWQGSDIVVKNEVRVRRPYLPENVTQEPATLVEEVKQRLKRKEEGP